MCVCVYIIHTYYIILVIANISNSSIFILFFSQKSLPEWFTNMNEVGLFPQDHSLRDTTRKQKRLRESRGKGSGPDS